MNKFSFRSSLRFAALLFTAFITCVNADQSPMDKTIDVDDIVIDANLHSFYAGDDGRSDARMLIYDAQGNVQRRQFTILRRDIKNGEDQQLLVFFTRPSDVKGTVFRVEKHINGDDERWIYLPGLDLLKRISAGDKRTSFVGSDYFYEDVSGRNLSEDNFSLISFNDQNYYIEGVPKDLSTVEFTRYEVLISKETKLPMKITYFDKNNKMIRKVEVLKTKQIQGHTTVTKSKVSNLITDGYTILEFRNTAYDLGFPSSIFSERSMRKPPVQWLKK